MYPMQMTDEPDKVGEPSLPSSAPRFVCFQKVKGGKNILYMVLCQIRSFRMALMVCFITHYVFNLEYLKPLKEVSVFVQDFVFG